MALQRYVTIENRCPEAVTVNLRVPRPKKGKPPSFRKRLRIKPGESSPPLPYLLVAGTSTWRALIVQKCLKFIDSFSLPRFFELENLSPKPLAFRVSPTAPPEKKRVARLKIKPGARSHAVDIKSLSKPRVDRLVGQGVLRLKPSRIIAPPLRGAPVVGSYFGEDVYVCYKCGRPIVFRGYPPRPVHI